jgi:hypothetical protein
MSKPRASCCHCGHDFITYLVVTMGGLLTQSLSLVYKLRDQTDLTCVEIDLTDMIADFFNLKDEVPLNFGEITLD